MSLLAFSTCFLSLASSASRAFWPHPCILGGKPADEVQFSFRRKSGVHAAQHLKRYAAVRVLRPVASMKLMAGLPTKSGDEQVVWAVVDVQRRVILLEDAVVYEAYLVASVMASIWSCVT